jgi:hypothetical protein
MTNPFRRYGAASLLMFGEAWVARPVERVETTAKATLGPSTWLGAGCSEGKAGKRRDLFGVCEPGRSQSLHSTAAAAPERAGGERTGEHKPARGKEGRKGDALLNETKQQTAGSADEATQGGEAARDFSWAEATVWTKRMLSALVNGVKAWMGRASSGSRAEGGYLSD